MKADNTNKVDCFQCKHFAVSWDANLPRACKLFGFKSLGMPSVVVYQSTGEECVGFEKKDIKQGGGS